MNINTNDRITAETILKQLGGNKFVVMTGAKEIGIVKNGIAMKIGRNSSSANCLRITLNAKDLYDMTFTKFTKATIKNNFEAKHKEIARFDDVYCDQLQEIFTRQTGMYTHL